MAHVEGWYCLGLVAGVQVEAMAHLGAGIASGSWLRLRSRHWRTWRAGYCLGLVAASGGGPSLRPGR
jgi:hypothetical protein